MANVIHRCNRQDIVGRVDNPHFLLTNSSGDYVCLGDQNHSNYDGFFIREGKAYFKIVSNISPAGPVEEMVLGDDHAVRSSSGSTQRIALLERGLLATCSGAFTLTLDCKRLYDESEEGRIYSVQLRPAAQPGGGERLANVAIIDVTYMKHSDGNLSSKEYELHVCIATTMRAELIKEWRHVEYPYDARRGTRNTRWVYDLLSLTGTGKVAIAASTSQQHAQRDAVDALIMQQHPRNIPALPTMRQLAWRSLDALRTRDGIMAGLPWFFDYWSRDELIACGGLIESKEYSAAISILDKWYGAIRADGTLPAIYPDEGLDSSDAPGWLGKRTRDMLVRMSDEGMGHLVPREKLERWREKTGMLLDAAQTRMQDGLVRSGPNTTWMDTSHDDDGREGYRIEIQALYLALYDCHAHLCAVTMTPIDLARQQQARATLEAVRSRMVKDGRLLDGLRADRTPDETVRPNIFIAWYVAPKLFTDAEWQGFFSAALPKLWLPWGGLASIATDHPNYHAHYSGESVASYHRGDSWYYVNNIAAMALRAVDAAGSQRHVDAIIAASVADLLWQGCCGHCSELSSAAAQEAAGTHCQAWSASTLLELLDR